MKLIRTFNSIAAIKSVLQKNSERPRNSVPLIPSLFLFAFLSLHPPHQPFFFPLLSPELLHHERICQRWRLRGPTLACSSAMQIAVAIESTYIQ